MSEALVRAFYVGDQAVVAEQLGAALGVRCDPGVPTAEDVTTNARELVVFLDPAASQSVLGELPGGNAFTACRDLKDRLGVQVYLLVRAGDQITTEIGRFCLADGSVAVAADGLLDDVSSIADRVVPHRPGVNVDVLLEKFERRLASDEGRQASAIQRMLAESEDSFMDHLVDAETGLFDGPYASFKLDEEFKRSRRFHQPLSLLLLDVGVDLDGFADANNRQGFLAEVSSVFLNECRDIDVIARFTASTFMVLMPGTGAAGADVVAARMLAGLAEKGIFDALAGQPHCGVATMPSGGIPDRSAFLARAEARLQISREGSGAAGISASSE